MVEKFLEEGDRASMKMIATAIIVASGLTAAWLGWRRYTRKNA